MKIINRKDFLQLPAGTVYREYSPSSFGPLMIKHDSLETDWYEQEVGDFENWQDSGQLFQRIEEMVAGKEFPMREGDAASIGRNGFFEPDQLFCILSEDDLRNVIGDLQKCLPVPPVVLPIPGSMVE